MNVAQQSPFERGLLEIIGEIIGCGKAGGARSQQNHPAYIRVHGVQLRMILFFTEIK